MKSGMMRCLYITCSVLAVQSAFAQPTKRLELTVTNAPRTELFLANYYGNRLFYADTAMTDAQGLAVFERKEGYKPGIYAVLLGPKRIQFLLNEPLVRLSTDVTDLQGKARVIGSKENEIHLVERPSAEAGPSDGKQARLEALAKKYQGTLAASLIKMDIEPITAQVKRADGSLDSAATNKLHLEHYWDNTDLMDDRLPNLPVFQNRLDDVVARSLPNEAGALSSYLEELAQKCSPATRAFLLRWANDKYGSSETRGLGAVPVRLLKRFVCVAPGMTPDTSFTSTYWQQACARVRIKSALIAGAPSRDLILPDTTAGKWVSLHKMPQEYVVVVFWSPHCSHCKNAVPALYTKYKEVLQAMRVGVYAVADASDNELFADWKIFVREHGLDWTNVGLNMQVHNDATLHLSEYVPALTNAESLNYKETWEATNTPKYFVLDRERRIVGQPESITGVIEMIRKDRSKGR